MRKLIISSLAAATMFGALDTLNITSFVALATAQQSRNAAQIAALSTALRARMNAIANARRSVNRADLPAAIQALENYLAATPGAASLVADVLASLPLPTQAAIAPDIGTAMGDAQERLIANGSPAALQAAARLAQEVQRMPPAVQQAVASTFQTAGGNPTFSALNNQAASNSGLNQQFQYSTGSNLSLGGNSSGAGGGGNNSNSPR